MYEGDQLRGYVIITHSKGQQIKADQVLLQLQGKFHGAKLQDLTFHNQEFPVIANYDSGLHGQKLEFAIKLQLKYSSATMKRWQVQYTLSGWLINKNNREAQSSIVIQYRKINSFLDRLNYPIYKLFTKEGCYQIIAFTSKAKYSIYEVVEGYFDVRLLSKELQLNNLNLALAKYELLANQTTDTILQQIHLQDVILQNQKFCFQIPLISEQLCSSLNFGQISIQTRLVLSFFVGGGRKDIQQLAVEIYIK